MQNRHKLILLITLILVLGFLSVSLLMYQVSKQSIRNAITLSELPLTGDSIYSEIQKDLVKSVNVSAMMAENTFLKDWVKQGEKDEAPLKAYLREVKRNNQALVSFFISERTHKYYSDATATKHVRASDPNDAWYFRVSNMRAPYEINVDRNAKYNNRLMIFVNYQVRDQQGGFMGITGLGIKYDTAKDILISYQQRFKHKIYLVDQAGNVVLSGDTTRHLGRDVKALIGSKKIKFNAKNLNARTIEYTYQDIQHLVNVRYVPELKWHLFVEKNETDATAEITNSLYRNLFLCLLITGLVVTLTHITLKRYHVEVESAAAIDSLTGLPNRKAFDIAINMLVSDSKRNNSLIGIMLMDLDYFKSINDSFGHSAGDAVLVKTAEVLRKLIRNNDFICRWGGEEFLIAIRNCDAQKLKTLAEKIRKAIEVERFVHFDQSISVTTSLGAAVMLADETMPMAIDRADKALYQAKQSGRNRVVLTK
jgi:diguanylate cyclase (GGDEF)-like protein